MDTKRAKAKHQSQEVQTIEQLPADVDHDDRLILWMLERTPAQRLEALQGFVNGIATVRNARKLN